MNSLTPLGSPNWSAVVARGDALHLPGPAVVVLPSPLPGVPDAPWMALVRVLATKPLSAVSDSLCLGMFEMRPRRLGDLGRMENLRAVRSPSGRMAWEGNFCPPLTQSDFLRSLKEQYLALRDSMIGYAEEIFSGDLLLPDDASLSGGLALLHRAGPGGLKSAVRFPTTESIFLRCNGIF